MTARRLALAAALIVAAQTLPAFEPELPLGARQTVERTTPQDAFNAPLEVYTRQGVPHTTIEGRIERRAWRIPTEGLTPLQLMGPLRDQIAAAGYTPVFECTARECGGFDFRFAVEVLPGPNMYVNLSEFRYLTALRGPVHAPESALTALVSTTAASAYVQIILAGRSTPSLPVTSPDGLPTEPNADVQARPDAAAANALLDAGYIVLDDLEFDVGTSALGPGPFASLRALANLMEARAGLRLALVGHTDAAGGLDVNITVSRERARSVRTRLVEGYGIDPERLEAEGVAYLSPIASNLTDAGRTRNRRVEAVLLEQQ